MEGESDVEGVEVVLNQTKQVTLQDWGWEGTIEDAYDTGTAWAVNKGIWELREDVEGQEAERIRLQCKKDRQTRALQRRELAALLLQLQVVLPWPVLAEGRRRLRSPGLTGQDGKAKTRMQAARGIAATAEAGDLAALSWLQRTMASEKDSKVNSNALECLPLSSSSQQAQLRIT
eukprot:1655847-Rhodomonas_salina.1